MTDIERARAIWGDFVTPWDIDLPESAVVVVSALAEFATPLVVGGAVRDSILNVSANKDVDIEVYGSDLDEIAESLRERGFVVNEVGKAFGVLKVRVHGLDVDVSVPRRENKVGRGHREFDVDTDPEMSVVEAMSRRDFTVNAVGYDPVLGVMVDPFNGFGDASTGSIRAVSDKFDEDPLRVLRGFQFAGRFGMRLTPETALRCRRLRSEYDTIPVERVRSEWEKFFTRSVDVDAAVDALVSSGWDDTIPGLRTALSNKETVHALSRLRGHPEDERVLLGVTVLALAPGIGDEDVLALGRVLLPSKSALSTMLALVNIVHNVDTDAAAVREVAVTLAKTGSSWSQVGALGSLLDNEDVVAVSVIAADLGVGSRPEADWVRGDDVLRLSSAAPGPWVKTVLNEFRRRQWRREFSGRDEALSELARTFS